MLKHFDRERLIWDSDLNTNESFLLLALNSFVDANGECWPGQDTLARMCKFTARTVRNTVKSLEAKGIIQKSHRYSNGHRTSDLYKVNFPRLSDFALSEPISELNQTEELIPEPNSSSKPEQDSTMSVSYRKMTTFIPENDDIHTGTIFQGSIQRSNHDLSSSLERQKPRFDPMAARFAQYEWMKNGQIDQEFAEFCGNQMRGKDDSMHPKIKGESFIRNCHRGKDGRTPDDVMPYWRIHQESKQAKDNRPRYVMGASAFDGLIEEQQGGAA